eukprot:scaffold973_cov399-Prasinococcus_capsulatus_cf.AAC.4
MPMVNAKDEGVGEGRVQAHRTDSSAELCLHPVSHVFEAQKVQKKAQQAVLHGPHRFLPAEEDADGEAGDADCAEALGRTGRARRRARTRSCWHA